MKTQLIPLLLIAVCIQVAAQEKLAHYFPAGQDNAEVLIDNYLKPMGFDISVLPNNGWYNTAKTHKKWGFDLSVSVNSIFVSNENKRYAFPSGLTGLSYLGTSESPSSDIPTAYGQESEFPQFNITSGANGGVSFRGPDGFDPESTYFVDAQLIPTIQGGLGIFKNTDLRFRFTPQVTISSVKYGNWGVGLMHDIKQYITGESDNKFALSLFLGYTQVNGTVDLGGIYSGNGQEGKVVASGFTGQAVISKEIGILTLYGALGYDMGKTNIKINGTYTVDSYVDLDGIEGVPLNQSFTLNDPFEYDYDKNGFRFTGGLRLALGPITLNGDFSFVGDKQVLTVGLGFLTDKKSNQPSE
jgi:hypothetical protein